MNKVLNLLEKLILIPIESKCKDLSDYIKMYGIEKTKILLNECI